MLIFILESTEGEQCHLYVPWQKKIYNFLRQNTSKNYV